MINPVAAIKSESNQEIRIVDAESLEKRIDHLDEGMHELNQRLQQIIDFIDEHRPVLARGMALMDPASGLRKLVTGHRKRDA